MDGTFRPGIMLTLADGARWVIRACDAEAARVVSQLGAAMRLQPAPPCPCGASPPETGRESRRGRELLVAVGRRRLAPANLSGPGPVVCILSPLISDDMLTIGMSQLALVIAREAQSRGGVLLHGALAERPTINRRADTTKGAEAPSSSLLQQALSYQPGDSSLGEGILLAGPGTVGKTTASNRLPPLWRSLCDDTTLVVRDAAGQYWAHPWPTWSRFYSIGGVPGPGGSWDVQRAVPLRAIFFLSQSPDDRVEPVNVPAAVAMLMETVQHVSRPMTRHLAEDEVQALHQEQLAAVNALARAIPAYTLHISLSGEFWKEIERVLQHHETRNTHHASRITFHASRFTPYVSPTMLSVVYTGPSMNPTLSEPDLLTVTPYESRLVRRGDVIYFQPPGGEQAVVHRVAAVTPEGIRTRGDNNSADDPYLLQASDIIGQVTAAQRGQRRRRIVGGWCGQVVMHWNRPWRLAFRLSARLLHGVYHSLAEMGVFRRLLPSSLRPRLVTFEARRQKYLKLMMGGRVVGQYDAKQEQWRIRRPFRLFVDEAALPRPQMAPHTMPVPRSLFTPGHVISSAADRQCGASGTKSPITDQM